MGTAGGDTTECGATHSYPKGPITRVEDDEMVVVGVERAQNAESDIQLG